MQVEELSLQGNPIFKIKHDAFKESKKIVNLNLRGVKFRNFRGDLKFLKRLYDLEDLDLSYAFEERNFTDLSRFYECYALQKLDMEGVGLVNLAGIKQLMPNLVYLDISDNNVFSFEIIEQLRPLEEFADINLKGNPICIHKHLKDEFL